MDSVLIRCLIFLACLAIWPAQAQQVSNPAIAPVPHNIALKAMGGTPQGAIRQGFYAAGDGGHQKYNWSPTNCTAADDGAQVQPTSTGCWIADIDNALGANVKIWGAKGNGDDTVDDGPAFRKACAWALTLPQGGAINIPTGVYYLLSLDSRGNGALYLGNGANDGRSCSLIGPQAASSLPAAGGVYGNVLIRLGKHLNRPLVFIPKHGSSPHIKNITLDGSGSNGSGVPLGWQDGWPEGPGGGRLYTVMVEDDTGPTTVETGPIFDDVVLTNGYNGNIYSGAGRYMWSNRLWSNYSGQNNTDCSIMDYAVDTVHIQIGAGSNQGCGMAITEGAQTTLYGGAFWNNNGAGLTVGGLQVGYLNIFGVNFQYNTYGIYNTNWPPFATSKASAITCTGCTFDGNTAADLYILPGSQVNRQMKLVSPSFIGNLTTAGAKPAYNIELPSGAGIVDIISPSLGSSGNPYTTAFTNSPGLVYCTGHECPSTAFLPTLGNGTPTYNLQQGYIMRYGHLAHLSLVLSTTALGSPTGNLSIGNIPYSSTTQTNYVAPCSIGTVAGWTPPAGSSWLTAQIPASADFIQLFRNSVVGGGAAASAASEWGPGAALTISCTYVPAT